MTQVNSTGPLPDRDGPGRLWSLWELMNHFKAGDFTVLVGKFATYQRVFGRVNGVVARDAEALVNFVSHLVTAAQAFKDTGIGDAAKRMMNIHRDVTAEPMHSAALVIEAKNARNVINEELSKRKFLRVAADRRHYLDRDDLFGADVSKSFPSAANDIRDAGNCLASECTTAAVFHAMRVAEYGLRALAYDRRIELEKKKPIELATWEDIIKKLEDAETEIKGYPKTLARESQYDFYHGAMMQFRGFKNVFRNQIMHSRKSYGRDMAFAIVNQVRDFMNILATRIAEDKRTPKRWKGRKWITS